MLIISRNSYFRSILIIFLLFSSFFNLFGLTPLSGDIQGTVWLDKDSSNTKGSLDDGIDNVRIELFLSSGILIQFQHTDNNGAFLFNNIPNGEYYIKVEKKDGLNPVLQNVGNDLIDSDIAVDGMSDFFIHTSSPSFVDAGFESSLYVISPNIIETCHGMEVDIELSPMSAGDNLMYKWAHDSQLSGNLATITASQTQIYTATITDEWDMPVIKEILVKVRSGVGEEFCRLLDPLIEGDNASFSLDLSINNPGPVVIEENVPSAFGGKREITFEIIEGTNTSSVDIDYTKSILAVSNGNGCRTKTKICYNGENTGDFLDLEPYSYIKMLNVLIDQGVIEVSVTITDINNQSSEFSKIIESQGFNSIFNEELYLSSFTQNLNLNLIKEICFELETKNTAIDFEISYASLCGEKNCQPTASAIQNICEGESTTIEGVVECSDNVVYHWDNNLGFGKTKMVSPSSSTVYTVTVYDLNGCSSTAQTTVNVNANPVIDLISSTVTICEGEQITLEVDHISGNGPYTYLWNNGMMTKSIMVSPQMDTVYSVMVFDTNSCSAEESVSIIVNEIAEFSVLTTPSNCAFFNGTASVDLQGGAPPFTYLWSNGETSPNLSNLPPGTLQLEITDGNQCVINETITIPSLNCAEIGDYVWHDLNANGIQDNGEPALEDVMVILKDINQQHLDTLFTDADGYYLFTPLDAGDYYVQFETPTDFIPTVSMNGSNEELDSNVNPVTGMTGIINLAPGQTVESIDAGYYQWAKIGNYVWHDRDRDGSQGNDEDGLAGVEVTLHSCNGVELQTTFTDTEGKYNFCDLLPGEYFLSFDTIPGFKTTSPDMVADYIDSDVDPISMKTECVVLASGEVDSLWDAGFYELAKIGDFVWIDQNLNGLQDSIENPLAGVEIKLYSCDTILLDSLVTDSLGRFIFCDLEPGGYQLYFPYLDGYAYTDMVDTLDQNLDSDVNNNGFTQCIDLEEGQKDTITDAGYYRLSSLGDFVWLDADVNGIQDTDEKGIEGIKVYLLNCNNEKLDSTYTNIDGFYLFDDLNPDLYKIAVETSSTYLITLLDQGNEVNDSDLDPITGYTECLDLLDGVDYRDLDIGLYSFSKIGNFVWHDVNGNGIQDIGEDGVEGVQVELLNCTSGTTLNTSTDSNGYYCFDNLLSDDYELKFNISHPFVIANQNVGSDDSIDSDADPLTGMISCFNLPPATERTDLDVGIHACSKIGNFVWFDAIENDIQDPNENGINGVKIKLYRLENSSWALVSNTASSHKPGSNSDDGWWELCVVPGQYYIEVESIDGVAFVSPDQGNNDLVDSDITGSFGPGTSDVFEVFSLTDDLHIDIGLKPVSLDENSGSFRASIDAIPGAHILRWESEDEQDAEFYRILKKDPNTSEFDILIDEETKKGLFNEYEFTDSEIEMDGLYSYRIKMFDILNETLDTQDLNITVEKNSGLYMFPNPVKSELNIVFAGAENDIVAFDILDGKGSLISRTSSLKLETTKIYSILVETKDIPNGIYYLRFSINDTVETKSFLKMD